MGSTSGGFYLPIESRAVGIDCAEKSKEMKVVMKKYTDPTCSKGGETENVMSAGIYTELTKSGSCVGPVGASKVYQKFDVLPKDTTFCSAASSVANSDGGSAMQKAVPAVGAFVAFIASIATSLT